MVPAHKFPKGRSDITLYSANGSTIKTYGVKILNLSLNLRRKFQWPFILADIKKPIIGADFLRHFGLLIESMDA